MELETGMLSRIIADEVCTFLEMHDFKVKDHMESMALNALAEIQAAVKNDDLEDFDAMEQIVCIFEKYNIDSTPRHDF